MFRQGSRWYSILRLKCPRCQQGEFLESHPYKLSDLNRVKNHCPQCGLKYQLEPSFYYGSMYVSYAVGVALAVGIFVLTQLLAPGMSLLTVFGCIVGGLVLLMPWIGAVSKSIWAHLFMAYDPKVARMVQDKRAKNKA